MSGDKDPINLIYLICLKSIDNRAIRAIMWYVLSVHLITSTIHIYYILTDYDRKLLTEYGSVLFGTIYGSCGIIVVFKINPDLKEFKTNMELLCKSYSCVNVETERNIKRLSTIMNSFLIIVLIYSGITGVFYTPPLLGKNEDLYFALYFSKKCSPDWQLILQIIYFSTLPLLGCFMVIQMVQPFYFVIHVIFQLMILCEDLQRIQIWKNLDFDSTNFQRFVTKDLKDSIKLHIKIKRLVSIFRRIFSSIMLCYMVTIICFVAALIYFILSNLSPSNLVRLFSTGAILLLFLVIICHLGQLIIDWSENSSNIAWDLPWITMNLENRRLLLIFLINSTEPVQITDRAHLIVINYNLAIRTARFLFSLYTILMKILYLQDKNISDFISSQINAIR